MIFVTVGTHEQQFNRLIKEIDRLKKENIIKEEVFVQTGYSDYEPASCKYKKFLSYSEMEEYIENASLVITHGGPASFMDALSRDKKTIVVPRLKKYDEHINDHQLEFVEKLEELYQLNLVTNMEKLGEVIEKVSLLKVSGFDRASNNGKFIEKFKEILGI